MKVTHFKDVKLEQVTDPSVKGITKRVLISSDDGAANFTMRMFHVEPGGYTFHHSHDFEHEIYIVEGKGEVITSDGMIPFEKGYTIFVKPGEKHQFRNTGKTDMTFLCSIPNEE